MSMLHEAIAGDQDNFRFNFMSDPGVTATPAQPAHPSGESVAVELNAGGRVSLLRPLLQDEPLLVRYCVSRVSRPVICRSAGIP